MARSPKNPIDPATGKRKRGRPPKVTPIDTISGPQLTKESAVTKVRPEIEASDTDALEVQALNPSDQFSTELAELWKQRFRGTALMEIPHAIAKRYPNAQFCWARDVKESISKYQNQFGYEPAETSKPLPGQIDTCFRHGDAILMMRPKWMKGVHDQVLQERLLAQLGNPPAANPDEQGAEREAIREARASGYGQQNRGVSFFSEETKEDAERVDAEERVARKQAFMSQPGRPRLATGTRYVSGGIPK